MNLDLSLHGRSLLGVFAHPDDESLACGGLLAWCTALGARVSLLCVTGGEHGPGGDTPDAGGIGLRRTRLEELRAAAHTLGVADLVVLDYEDGMLPWVDPQRPEQDLDEAIRRTAPDVVITFDEDGLYWHPDHVALHERTTAVVARLGDAGPALYYTSLPPGAMRAVVQHAADTATRGSADGPAPHTILGVEDADAFGALAPAPTLVVDASRFAPRKLAALACHRTQLRGSALACVTADDAGRLLGIEHYRRASIGAKGDCFLERFAAPRSTTGCAASGTPPCTTR